MDFVNFAVDVEPLDEDHVRLGGFWNAGDHGRTFFGWPQSGEKVTLASLDPRLDQWFPGIAGRPTALAQAEIAEENYARFIENPRAGNVEQPLRIFGRWLLEQVLLGCGHDTDASDGKDAFDEACAHQSELRASGTKPVLRLLLKFILSDETPEVRDFCERFQSLTFEMAFRHHHRPAPEAEGFLLRSAVYPVALCRTPSELRAKRDATLSQL